MTEPDSNQGKLPEEVSDPADTITQHAILHLASAVGLAVVITFNAWGVDNAIHLNDTSIGLKYAKVIFLLVIIGLLLFTAIVSFVLFLTDMIDYTLYRHQVAANKQFNMTSSSSPVGANQDS